MIEAVQARGVYGEVSLEELHAQMRATGKGRFGWDEDKVERIGVGVPEGSNVTVDVLGVQMNRGCCFVCFVGSETDEDGFYFLAAYPQSSSNGGTTISEGFLLDNSSPLSILLPDLLLSASSGTLDTA